MRISRSSRSARVFVAAILTMGLGLSAGSGAISPAAATTKSFVSTPNGMVGMTQEILIFAPALRGQGITIGFALGSAGSSQQTTVGSNGYAYMNWTPNLAGSWTISGLGNALGVGSTTISIAAMPTTTQLFVPSQATSNAVSVVAVVVSALDGSLAPEGIVNLNTGFGNPVGTQQLTPIAGSSSSYANFNWQPQILGPFPLVASYNPSSNATTASSAPQSTSQIVPNAGVVELRLPATFRVGVPTLLSAMVTPSNTVGTAAFQLNGGYLSGSIPLSNGIATTQWTPTQQGNQTIITQFTSTTPAGLTGQVSQVVNVLPPLPADTINVNAPSGPWGPGRPIAITAGRSIQLTLSTSSNTQVLLSENGPCSINGAVITGLGAGTCTLTAVSVGGNGYSASSSQFVVTVTAPPRKRR